MSQLITKVLLSYLLGSLIGSLIVGRLRGSADIRTLGSGNAGATNALRTQGKAVGLTVLVFDLLKGWIATAVIATWHAGQLAAAGAAPQDWAPALCGLAVMLGHVYPLFYGFRGGKGVATLIGAVLGIHAWLLIPMVVTWFVVVMLSGYVSLASMLAALALVIAIGVCRQTAQPPLLTFGVLAGLLIVYTHRSNIARIRAGNESRARRLWLFGRKPDGG